MLIRSQIVGLSYIHGLRRSCLGHRNRMQGAMAKS